MLDFNAKYHSRNINCSFSFAISLSRSQSQIDERSKMTFVFNQLAILALLLFILDHSTAIKCYNCVFEEEKPCDHTECPFEIKTCSVNDQEINRKKTKLLSCHDFSDCVTRELLIDVGNCSSFSGKVLNAARKTCTETEPANNLDQHGYCICDTDLCNGYGLVFQKNDAVSFLKWKAISGSTGLVLMLINLMIS